jgi:phosphoribosylformimino-5-aminoimidazole carboxamide ribotide isomerase|tara:strand:+ start:1814 stop:2530 length:717 start_codon:yes stop_codon:yes gene_type:complete
MKIFPAIDLKNGKCIRLTKGDFKSEKIYNEDPIDQAENFSNDKFKYLHIIDLDGALKGSLINIKIIEEIIKKFNFKIQVGGGIRNKESLSRLLDVGVDKVILGTAAIKNKNFLEDMCNKYSNKIALAIDVRDKKIALSGWKDQTEIKALDFLNSIKDIGVSRLIYTDINKDGTGHGPNFKECYDVATNIKIPLIVSGGISSIDDVKKIIKEQNKNIEGIIIGKAIYERKIDIQELKEI